VNALELTVDQGRPASAGRFFRLGVDLLDLLDELSDVPRTWLVDDLRTGSALVTVAPPIEHPEEDRLLRLVVESLGAVQGGGRLTDDWSPDAVRVAHRFVEHAQTVEGESGWTAPRLRLVTDEPSPHRAVSLTPDLRLQLADLQPFERRMPGSVRGTLVGLNVSRGNRASLRLPTGKIVRVGFDSALRVDLKEALYQEVELRGELKQDADGRPFHVRAEEASVLRKSRARWADLIGIDPDYLEGIPVDEWLEANRGEA
jgi:hypothetical protein